MVPARVNRIHLMFPPPLVPNGTTPPLAPARPFAPVLFFHDVVRRPHERYLYFPAAKEAYGPPRPRDFTQPAVPEPPPESEDDDRNDATYTVSTAPSLRYQYQRCCESPWILASGLFESPR